MFGRNLDDDLDNQACVRDIDQTDISISRPAEKLAALCESRQYDDVIVTPSGEILFRAPSKTRGQGRQEMRKSNSDDLFDLRKRMRELGVNYNTEETADTGVKTPVYDRQGNDSLPRKQNGAESIWRSVSRGKIEDLHDTDLRREWPVSGRVGVDGLGRNVNEQDETLAMRESKSKVVRDDKRHKAQELDREYIKKLIQQVVKEELRRDADRNVEVENRSDKGKKYGKEGHTKICETSDDDDDVSEDEDSSDDDVRRKIKHRNKVIKKKPRKISDSSGDDPSSDDDKKKRKKKKRNSSPDDNDKNPKSTRNKNKSRKRYKEAMPETFDGTSSLDTFLRKFELCAEHNEWDEKAKASMIQVNLTGAAAHIIGKTGDKRKAYKQIVKTLKQRYGTDDEVAVFRAQLKSRKRKKNESIRDFYVEIRKLVIAAYPGPWTEINESLGMDSFIDGLGDRELSISVRDRAPKTLDEAFKMAVISESYRTDVSTVKYSDDLRRDRNVRAAACEEAVDNDLNKNERFMSEMMKTQTAILKQMQQQNVKRDSAINNHKVSTKKTGEELDGSTVIRPNDKENAAKSDIKCYNCLQYGHISIHCKQPKTAKTLAKLAEKAQLRSTENASHGNGRPDTCYGCGQVGHYARNCPEKQRPANNFSVHMISQDSKEEYETQNQKGRRVYLEASYDNKKRHFLLDSGCDISVIPARMLNNVKLQQSDKKLFAANGTLIGIQGKAIINLFVGQLMIPTTVLVTEHVREPMLGIDFLQQNRCRWNFEDGEIEVRGHKIPVIKKDASLSCSRVVALENVRIPAWSQCRIPGKIEYGNLRQDIGSQWVTNNTDLIGGLRVARVVFPDNVEAVPVLVMNSAREDVTIQKGTVLSDLFVAEVLESNDKEFDGESDCGHLEGLMDGISLEVNATKKAELKELLKEYKDIFSTREYDLGETSLAVHTIDTGGNKPVKQQLRRQPPVVQSAIDKQVGEMLKAGIIEPSTSPWSSNVVMIKKKDGSLRFCVDYRKLNSVTVKDSYPLPRIDSCLETLEGSNFFSGFDLCSGYYQVKMDEKDAPKTGFVTRNGLWQFRKMSMGLTNSGATFQRVMDLAMRGLNMFTCLVYLDDIIVFSKDVASHLVRLRQLFQRLRTANLKMKVSKCKLFREELVFLGHVISKEGIATDPQKIKAVIDWPVPTSIREVRSFLGLCSYYRRFVKDFAHIAEPLHALTGKYARFEWDDKCQTAFEAMKGKLTTSPILCMPRDEGQMVLDTDASDHSIGAVLSQNQDGEEKVIAYASRLLTTVERRWCVTRKELLAVIFYMKSFRQYLLGRSFKVRTDHAALQWLKSTPEPIGQNSRWVEQLEEYDYIIEHRPGRAHGNADGMSRKPAPPCRQCGWDSESPNERWQRAEQEREERVQNTMQLRAVNHTEQPREIVVSNDKQDSMEQDQDQQSRENRQEREQERQTDNIEVTIALCGPVEVFDELLWVDEVSSPAVIEVVCIDSCVNPAAELGNNLKITNDQDKFVDEFSTLHDDLFDEDYYQADLIRFNEPEPNSEWDHKVLAEATKNDPELKIVLQLIERCENNEKIDQEEIAAFSKTVKSYYAQRDRLKIFNGLLYRKLYGNDKAHDAWQLIPPVSYRKEIITAAHSMTMGGHVGLRKTLSKIQSKAYWLDWTKEVSEFVLACENCAKYFRGTPARRAFLQRAPVGEVMERISIDITGPWPVSQKGRNMYMITAMDLFSKFAWAVPTRDHVATTVARVLVEEIFLVWGIPMELLSDQGPELQSNIMQELCTLLEIDKLKTTSYHPQNNGGIERFHRSLNQLLGRVVQEDQRNWDEMVGPALAAYRSTIHSATGYTPNYLMFGREVCTPLDLIYGQPEEEKEAVRYCDYVFNWKEKIAEAYTLAREQLGTVAERSKKRYDMKVRPKALKVGDFVWYYCPRRIVGKSPKLQRNFSGPYLLKEFCGPVNVRLQKSPRSDTFVTHLDKIKKCYTQGLKSWLPDQQELITSSDRRDNGKDQGSRTKDQPEDGHESTGPILQGPSLLGPMCREPDLPEPVMPILDQQGPDLQKQLVKRPPGLRPLEPELSQQRPKREIKRPERFIQ